MGSFGAARPMVGAEVAARAYRDRSVLILCIEGYSRNRLRRNVSAGLNALCQIYFSGSPEGEPFGKDSPRPFVIISIKTVRRCWSPSRRASRWRRRDAPSSFAKDDRWRLECHCAMSCSASMIAIRTAWSSFCNEPRRFVMTAPESKCWICSD